MNIFIFISIVTIATLDVRSNSCLQPIAIITVTNTVLEIIIIIIIADVETFYIRKGSNGTLPCLPADNQASSHKIEWYKEDKKLVEVGILRYDYQRINKTIYKRAKT